ncbi:Uncharacterised protein [uncultured archaeon]|nr:Uncharacterised protein [uncultured archaeon]
MRALVLLSLLVSLLLLSGCAAPAPPAPSSPPAGVSNAPAPSPAPAEVPPSPPPASCPYSGIYSGTVSGSGQNTHLDADNQYTEHTPYIVTYSLEFELSCMEAGTRDNRSVWYMNITRARTNEPYFGCTNGCALPPVDGFNIATLPLPGERGGQMLLLFPNGKAIQVLPLLVDSDGMAIRADQSDHEKLIYWSLPGFRPESDDANLEVLTCQNCLSQPKREGLTMVLNKIG